MPGAEDAPAALRRHDATLHFDGALVAGNVAALWTQALVLVGGTRHFDLAKVVRIDSAGLALLAELAQRAGGVAVDGDPAGLVALRAAYRLTPTLAYAA
jgi:phospholipid transport system transporter-binding protein